MNTTTTTNEELAQLATASDSDITRKAAAMATEQGNIIILYMSIVGMFVAIMHYIVAPMFSSVMG